jgi:hypothetical protein
MHLVLAVVFAFACHLRDNAHLLLRANLEIVVL